MVKWDDTVLNWLYQLLFSCFYHVKLNPHTMLGCVCFWRRGGSVCRPSLARHRWELYKSAAGPTGTAGVVEFQDLFARTLTFKARRKLISVRMFTCVYVCMCTYNRYIYIHIFMHIYSGLSVSNCLANLASLFLKSSVQSRRQTEERFELLKRIMEQQK